MFNDHEYEGNGGPCQALVLKYNHDKEHDYPMGLGVEGEYCTRCESDVVSYVDSFYDGYPASGGSKCNCEGFTSDTWVCKQDGKDFMDKIHARLTNQPCKADKWSVLHPVEGHWCEALENGYDCMHFED